MIGAVKRRLKECFPRFYDALYSGRRYIERQSRTEYKVLRNMLVRKLWRGTLFKPSSWQDELPVQTPRCIEIAGGRFNSIEDICGSLDSRELSYSLGREVIYLPPSTARAEPFGELMRFYPRDAGIKIFRTSGVPTEGRHIPGSRPSNGNKEPTQHDSLSLVANLLNQAKLGPRLYDVVELSCGDTVWPAYVIQHIEGRQPTASDHQQGLARIQEFIRDKVLRLATHAGAASKDSEYSEYNGSARIDENGRFRYFGFQDYLPWRYGRYLNQVALRSVKDVHFGERSLLRHGRFLYQTIPGSRLPAKRNTDDRMAVLGTLMDSAGLSVKNRMVLDIGCNTGMMMAQYLKMGATWCHGWDNEQVVPHTDALLFALGCTRFSTTGALIDEKRALEEDLPDFAKALLTGCVISYLAIRYHVGWLEALGRIPWSFMIYEGHQYESREQCETFLGELRELVDVEVVERGSYKDGFSDERDIAIVANVAMKTMGETQ